jgi:hypothetical protein
MRALAAFAVGAGLALAAAPTWHGEVKPIVAEHCEGCHRPGEIAPMSFQSYKEVRPWAAAIKRSVSSKRMPPWFADAPSMPMHNDRSLPQAKLDTLVQWVEAGAPEGSAKKNAPASQTTKTYAKGWNIPQPDMVWEMKQPFAVPKDGKVDYHYIVMPTGFTEDKWVRMAEARPSDFSVVHHIVVYIREKGNPWLSEAQPYVPYLPAKAANGKADLRNTTGGNSEVLTTYSPGNVPDVWEADMAKLVPAGADLVLQMHYTPNLKQATQDQSKLGLVFAKAEDVKRRVLTMSVNNIRFAIPPQADNHAVEGRSRIPNEAKLLSMFPHMHLRGKAFEYRLRAPGKEPVTLLKVGRYDFNWQLNYKLKDMLTLPAGSVIEGTAWYDNSPNNKYNPDPTATVRFGEQSEEEMMFGFFDLMIDAKKSLREFFTPPKPATAGM